MNLKEAYATLHKNTARRTLLHKAKCIVAVHLRSLKLAWSTGTRVSSEPTKMSDTVHIGYSQSYNGFYNVASHKAKQKLRGESTGSTR